MSANLIQLAPGITVLKMRFDLADAERAGLQRIMERSFETKVTPLKGSPGGQEIRGPEHRKVDEIQARRKALRSSARTWVKDHVPGLFSSVSDETPPAWDLLLTGQAQLYETSPYEERWRIPLGFAGASDEWTKNALPALRLIRPLHADPGQAVASLVGIVAEALPMLEGQYMGDDLPGLIFLVDRHLSDLLGLWTLLIALDSYGDQFAAMRDELAAPPPWYGSKKRLRRLQREVMPMGFDLRTFGEAAQNERALAMWIRWTSTEFELTSRPGRPDQESETRTLLAFLREEIGDRGARIAPQARDIAEGLRTQGELLLATSNARIQWLVVLLTLVVGAAGVIATISS